MRHVDKFALLHDNEKMLLVKSKRLNRYIVSAIVFLIVFAGHLTSRNISSADSRWSIHTAQSIIDHGNTSLDDYVKKEEASSDYRIERIGDHYYSIFPVGASIMAIPFVWSINYALHYFRPAMEKVAAYYVTKPGYSLPESLTAVNIYPGMELLVASFIIALATVFVFLTANEYLNGGNSLLCAFVFAFCTSTWSVASRGLWSHGPTILSLSAALFFLVKARRQPWIVQFAGIPLAFSYIARPTNIISILILSIFVFLKYRKHFALYVIWAMTILVPFVMFNYSVYHAAISPYYRAGRIGYHPLFLEALVGNLISPARGLFVFTPLLLFFLYGVYLKKRDKEFELLDAALLFIILLHWIASSAFHPWQGGHTFGPRYMSDMIPYMVYFLISPIGALFSSTKTRRGGRLLFLALILLSFFIHYRGATDPTVYEWNREPINVDLRPQRIWDWKDVQFLRGLSRPHFFHRSPQ